MKEIYAGWLNQDDVGVQEPDYYFYSDKNNRCFQLRCDDSRTSALYDFFYYSNVKELLKAIKGIENGTINDAGAYGDDYSWHLSQERFHFGPGAEWSDIDCDYSFSFDEFKQLINSYCDRYCAECEHYNFEEFDREFDV